LIRPLTAKSFIGAPQLHRLPPRSRLAVWLCASQARVGPATTALMQAVNPGAEWLRRGRESMLRRALQPPAPPGPRSRRAALMFQGPTGILFRISKNAAGTDRHRRRALGSDDGGRRPATITR
jgi:hypothetical protein